MFCRSLSIHSCTLGILAADRKLIIHSFIDMYEWESITSTLEIDKLWMIDLSPDKYRFLSLASVVRMFNYIVFGDDKLVWLLVWWYRFCMRFKI